MKRVHLWGDKPWHSIDHELKMLYGGKVYRLSLSSGCTCPNRDGRVGRGGCIFCSREGSGEFAASFVPDIDLQIKQAREKVAAKLTDNFAGYIAYFQSFSNTYADISYLREIFTKAILDPNILILSVATRPDCLPDEVIGLLCELNRIKPVWVELGLQTVRDDTGDLINRCFTTKVYEDAVQRLNICGIKVITHVICGLPGESTADAVNTVRYLAGTPIYGVKLHNLYCVKNTRLDDMKDVCFPTLREYVEFIGEAISILPEHITIHRLTGDPPKKDIVAPLWCTDKKRVLNSIYKYCMNNGIFQGMSY